MSPEHEPVATLDHRFSQPDAEASSWPEGRDALAEAEIYWLSTVRDDGRPHVTPLIAVWFADALWFCTGPDEQKARNLERNRRCALTTGRNDIGGGLDIVVEGEAVQVADEALLRRLADAYVEKYGEFWRFAVAGGAFENQQGGRALVFRVAPTTVFGFRKGDEFSQTRWRFEATPT